MTDFDALTVGDATHRAYVRFADPSSAGVVVLHAWWGLNDDVIAYADRLADAGFGVLAPDMFRGQVASTVEDAERLAGEGDAIAAPIAFGAVDRLGELLGPDVPLAVLGFSFGAAYALWAPSERDRLRATVVYYGTYVDEYVQHAKAPLLGHFAEHDDFEPEENVRELEDGFRRAGREVTIHRYPGTGHWFAEPSRDAYRKVAAELAFERTLTFLRATLGP